MEIHRDRYTWQGLERCGGVLCFLNTRIPVAILFDYLRAGDPMRAFLEAYPDLDPQLVRGYLDSYTDDLKRPAA